MKYLVLIIPIPLLIMSSFIPKNIFAQSYFLEQNMFDAAEYSESLGGAAVLIMQYDSLVFEAYHNGANSSTATHIYSATKGFWSIVAAHALETGLIQSYDELVANTITEWQNVQQHPAKNQITIRHLLSLSSGLSQDVEAIQGLDAEANDIYQYVIDSLDINFVPGNVFQYGPSHYYAFAVLLERKLHNAGIMMNPLEYLDSIIFQPIGFEYEQWAYDSVGNPHIPNGCFTTPRNWIKYGKLLLHTGNWNGTQLVDSFLVEDLFINDGPNPGHGKFLWLNNVDGQGAFANWIAPPGSPGGFIYYNGFTEIIGALGGGRNSMYIIPSLNTIILRQTLLENDGFDDHTFLSYLLDDITSIEKISNVETILLYPNPVSENITVKSETTLTKYILMNSSGTIIQEKSNLNEKHLQVDMSNLSNGIYFLHLIGKNQPICNRKIIKVN